MKKLVFVLLIMVIALISQMFLPWWSIAIVCFLVCYFSSINKFMAFSGSLIGIFVLWVGKAMIADGLFDTPVSEIVGGILGNVSPSATYFLTGLVGGIVGGLSGLLGSWARSFKSI